METGTECQTGREDTRHTLLDSVRDETLALFKELNHKMGGSKFIKGLFINMK